MNWAALVVVTGLSTLFMLIQYVANQRQFDFNLDDPLERPVNQPSPPVGAAPSAENHPAIRSSSPDRHRGIDLTFEARSPDDDCSSSYLLNKPLHPPFIAPSPTDSGCSQYQRNAGSSLIQQPGSDGDCTGRRQSSETDCYKLGGTTSCISDQSIYCGGGGSRNVNVNDLRRKAHGSVSSPCQSYGDSAASPRSFECDAANAVDQTGTGSGRRWSTEAVEIVGPLCDDENAPEGEAGEAAAAAAAGEDCDPQPPSATQLSPRQMLCERAGLAASRWIDYVVLVLFILGLLVLIIQFINEVSRKVTGRGWGDDDEGLCSQVMKSCSGLRSSSGCPKGCKK